MKKTIISSLIVGIIFAILTGIVNNYLSVVRLEVKFADLEKQMNGRMTGLQKSIDGTDDRVDDILFNKRDK
jgi:hypothetical protein